MRLADRESGFCMQRDAGLVMGTILFGGVGFRLVFPSMTSWPSTPD